MLTLDFTKQIAYPVRTHVVNSLGIFEKTVIIMRILCLAFNRLIIAKFCYCKYFDAIFVKFRFVLFRIPFQSRFDYQQNNFECYGNRFPYRE